MKKETKALSKIPSDELIKMTKVWHKAFNVNGCDPKCHGCLKMIEVGDSFKLATVESNRPLYEMSNGLGHRYLNDETESMEVMLCSTCTPKDVKSNSKKSIKIMKEEEKELTSGGCFRINGKIVHE